MNATNDIIKDIPANISDSQVVIYIHSKDFDTKQVKFFKELTHSTDKIISEWFDISEKTFQSYRSSNSNFNINFKEKLILLLSLYKQGERAFGSKEEFNEWLEKPNFHFNNEPPVKFFKTISGIRYIEDRLTGMEYGDNA
ncbi:MbcA/ParS/Xre antitoxin family protein [Salegentibacter sp. JZCK2]|uniref:antitoxin Xre/MbcA/ParS toxin-binding domain-containing protein n=1 Tax=Salegentibacter tibetensis TaxID=2873600 RepID=UPI001CCFD88B|nr:MbcA/ParS/Xre antitoxin family protein [Salegentibacter tibetensis]MBZ9729400.1 MbcA/ParS/Xre antitoxin family protein [Salegentibacter tibetensis]